MRIALLIERFDPLGGGLERWAWQLAEALIQRGHSITVLTFHTARPITTDIHLQLVPWHSSRLVRAQRADALLASLNVDVAHDLGVGWTAPLLHPQSGVRLANAQREFLAGGPLRRLKAWANPRRQCWLRELKLYEQRCYHPHSRSLVISVSRMVSEDLQSWFGLKPERIRMIPNGIDATRFSPADPLCRQDMRRRLKLVSSVVFLFSAQNPWLKGLQPLLQAFGRISRDHPQLALVVIGRDPDQQTLATVRRLGLQHVVRFPGFVADPRPYYAAADVFVLPSWHDACSLSVLEACACGLPVITTRANGVADLLTDGQEGRIIATAADQDALAASLLQMARPEIRRAMAVQALATGARHDFRHNVDSIEALYCELRGGKRPSEASCNVAGM